MVVKIRILVSGVVPAENPNPHFTDEIIVR